MLFKSPITRVFLLAMPGIALVLFVALQGRGQTGQPLTLGRFSSAERSRPAEMLGRPMLDGRPIDLYLPGITELGPIPPPQAPPYQGSNLYLDDEVKGKTGIFQRHFAESFRQNDTQPESRFEHFTWIPFSNSLVRIGWNGAITSIQPQADDSVVVIIKIQPQLYGNNRESILNDFVHEKYLVSDGRIMLIDTDAHNAVGHYHEWPTTPRTFQPGIVPSEKK